MSSSSLDTLGYLRTGGLRAADDRSGESSESVQAKGENHRQWTLPMIVSG
jgi:hypothetical protein